MFHSHARRPSRNESKFYDLLGVSKTASPEELKKAYKKAAIICHPDKGGDQEKFKELAHAYDILSDPEKRSIYDQYGEEGLKEGMGHAGASGFDPSDLFSAVFGGDPFGDHSGGSSRGRGQRRRRTDNVVRAIDVTLENIYNGVVKKLSVTRQALCGKCKGTGSKTGRSAECKQCKGSGRTVQYVRLGMGLMQQIEQICSGCEGKGEVLREKDKCLGCKGEKVVPESKILEVRVEKGMKDGEKISFPGLAHDAPNAEAGDLIFVLKQKPHTTFKRIGDDLFMERSLSLAESLCGFSFRVPHLDGRHLLIKTQPGEVIKPGQAKAIENEGMPRHKQSFLQGRLFISFSVEFPESGSLTFDQVKLLLTGLPPSPSPSLSEEDLAMCEETTLHDCDVEAEMKRKEKARREAYEEEDGHEGHEGHGVQCAQS